MTYLFDNMKGLSIVLLQQRVSHKGDNWHYMLYDFLWIQHGCNTKEQKDSIVGL
jgi:hypothetical protein